MGSEMCIRDRVNNLDTNADAHFYEKRDEDAVNRGLYHLFDTLYEGHYVYDTANDRSPS